MLAKARKASWCGLIGRTAVVRIPFAFAWGEVP